MREVLHLWHVASAGQGPWGPAAVIPRNRKHSFWLIGDRRHAIALPLLAAPARGGQGDPILSISPILFTLRSYKEDDQELSFFVVGVVAGVQARLSIIYIDRGTLSLPCLSPGCDPFVHTAHGRSGLRLDRLPSRHVRHVCYKLLYIPRPLLNGQNNTNSSLSYSHSPSERETKRPVLDLDLASGGGVGDVDHLVDLVFRG